MPTAPIDPDAGLKLSVIVPVYNERYLVRELLERVAAVSVPGVDELEVIVVDDGSTDGTREVLRRSQPPEPPWLHLLEQPRNSGKGAALRTRHRRGDGDLIVFQDADLEYDPRDFGGAGATVPGGRRRRRLRLALRAARDAAGYWTSGTRWGNRLMTLTSATGSPTST